MDTPERSKAVATPLSKSEDSPVFNFLNNLSPIQPVKSVHTAQTFHSLTFASISSIFASPHVNPQRESRFLIRNSIPDFGKHEASSGNDEDVNLQAAGPNAVKSSSCAALASESCAITCSLNEATAEPPDESLSLPNNLSQAVQYDCGSPNHNTTPCYAIRPDLKLDIGDKSVQLVQFVQDGLDKRKNLFTTEIELQGKAQLEKVKEEMPGCDWEALISDEAGDLLIFDSSTESKAREGPDGMPADNHTATSATLPLKPEEDVSGLQKTQSDAICGPFFENTKDPHDNINGEILEQYETDHTPQILTISCHNQAATGDENQNLGNGSSDCISLSCKVDSQQQRGARRRCLVFEVAGLSRKNMHKESSHLPSLSLPSNKNFSSDDTQSVSLKIGASPSPRVLPGIGLHLNALATTSKDRMVTQDTLPSGRRLISMPCSIGPFHTTTSGQKILDKSLAVENTLGHPTTELQDLQVELYDDSQGPSFKSCEDMSQSSPKKKKRKSENGNEGEACKRCNCKKSKCLKLYCECFAAGVYCVEPCSCQGCFNKPVHEETVLATRKQIESRNPLAFAPKVIRVPEPVQDIVDDNNKTPASARHKRGCNCKKSSCLKKYCECYQGGVGCSISCRCEGCKNAFGRKDGSEECEQEGEEMAVCENEGEKPDGSQQNVDVQMDERNSPENTLAITPFQICRSSAKQPFISSGKPPRSSTFPIGYSPRLNISQALRKCQIPLPQRKSEKHVKTATEDDTPEILRGNASPSSGVKTASPNRKRVSPPHNGIAFSPNHKGSRKLILKSIPSFPSLSSEVISEYQMSYPMSSYNSG